MRSAFDRLRQLAVACLLCLGFWQFSHGTGIPAKAWLAQELMQRAWERASPGAARPAPWPWPDAWPVARLFVSSADVDLIVLAGNSGRMLMFGPGHIKSSALPGQTGNCVIVGHRDTHFSFLRRLKAGETLLVETTAANQYLYEVVDIDVVDARRGSLLLDTKEPVLSLVSGYPFETESAGGPLRYVVTAKMVRSREFGRVTVPEPLED